MPGAHLPYRGEPVPDFPKPKKRVRNLRQERITRVLILGICILIMSTLLGVLLSSLQTNSGDYTVAFVTGFAILVLLCITIAIADGLKSINRFRKGYDIDISREAEEAVRDPSEDDDDQ
ncbi:MAG: hypothetical protein ACM33V_10785 [Chloroflexota bacterium]|nr:hypothetical protein [Anaerolineales bacterium]